jgi:hypothetical protein
MERGDMMKLGNVEGRYVGTSSAGVVWVAYEDRYSDRMCKRFDDRQVRTVRISQATRLVVEEAIGGYRYPGLKLASRYVRAPHWVLCDLAAYIEEGSSDAGECAMYGVSSSDVRLQEFARKAATVARQQLAARLRGQHVATKALWKEVQ